MKGNLAQITLAATLAIGAAANSHQHLHRHAKKDALKARDTASNNVVQWVPGPVEVVYVMDGEKMDPTEAQECLKDGSCVSIGASDPTLPPPPPPPATTSSTAGLGAQFFEKSSSSSHPAYSTSQPPPKSSPTSQPSTPSQGGTGLNAKFPSGQIKCSEFPSAYGAIFLDWLGFGGWSGLQGVPDYAPGVADISSITTGISGNNCSPNTMCSYACPPGYQKTQWPAAQGATGQSIGGLWCNSDGFLELTRPGSQTLCEQGAGGVSIQNDLDENVATCRTDYPGTENMVIPIDSAPGSKMQVTNPIQNQYYQWQGKKTSAQYYINPKGVRVKDACLWNSPTNPGEAGNYAPMNLGVGVADGNTYIGLFLNTPSSSAMLKFSVQITVNGNVQCTYSGGQFSAPGASSKGCTVTAQQGQQAVIRYYSS